MLLRILLLIVIVFFSLLGYLTYLNHEIQVTFSFVKGKPIRTSLPAVIIVSFASGALIVFMGGLIRDLVEGWRDLKRDRRVKRKEAIQAEIARGFDFLFKGNVERGIVHLTNALERDPENLGIHTKLSDIYAGQGRLKESVEVLERAWAIDPQNEEILLKKARLYNQMGNFAMATDTLEKVLSVDPKNLTALVALRDIYLQQESWKEAMGVQKSILKTSRNDADNSQERTLYLGLKFEYAQSLAREGSEGSLEKAVRLGKEMIKQQREFGPAYILLGDIYQHQKRWVEAGRILGRGFRVSKSVVFLLRIEELYLKRDDRKTLLKIYRRALENNPDNTVIPFFYSRLCLKLGMLDDAMDELVEIKERRKDIAPLHGLMAEVFAQKGLLEEAVREFTITTELAGSLRLPFVCRSCQREAIEWVARCPSCDKWNTYFLEGEEGPHTGMEGESDSNTGAL